MSLNTASKLDIEKFRKVHALMTGGATEGERTAAKTSAEKMARRANMTLQQALSAIQETKAQASKGIFEGFDDWMEEKHPGFKAQKAREQTARDIRDNARRAEVLSDYGSEAALFSRNEQERLLDAAITPWVSSWRYWTDQDGTEYRYAEMLDGKSAHYWSVKDITPAIREVVTTAYPWPSNLDAALKEVQAWDRLRWDRGLFSGGEYNHYAEVECRISLLEHALEQGQPAASWDDIQARFNWKRYEFERQWIDPTEREDAFMDRLEDDMKALHQLYGNPPVQTGHMTTSARRNAVLSILDIQPELSDREIARQTGVSPQTVGNLRKKRKAV
ncbi:hypothetical protein [Pseudochrobactrum sp. AO18b]|uniref:hypothetical protein n=1 Tax=Pseudochrobactrum sp. AO18b TaxID=1201036 RepID=UPI0003A235CB|nr:hypothetical protein [Pseudochrobactrum sp. AO18b]